MDDRFVKSDISSVLSNEAWHGRVLRVLRIDPPPPCFGSDLNYQRHRYRPIGTPFPTKLTDRIGEAIAIADRFSDDDVVEPVAEAVWKERPQWTIDACKQQAEPIIEEGQSERY